MARGETEGVERLGGAGRALGVETRGVTRGVLPGTGSTRPSLPERGAGGATTTGVLGWPRS